MYIYLFSDQMNQEEYGKLSVNKKKKEKHSKVFLQIFLCNHCVM